MELTSKKKLLITVGCSYTEGVGCYDMDILNNYNLNELTFDDKLHINKLNEDRFHTHGWPSKLQKLLKYDKLINIGKSGASNSQCVKTWFENISDINLDEYDVLVIWLMTYSGRISFYKNGMTHSILPNLKVNPKTNPHMDITFEKLYESYASFLSDNYFNDINLEATFYLKIIQKICNLSNYQFFYFNADVEEGKLIDKIANIKHHSLNKYFNYSCPNCLTILDHIGNNRSPLSFHPNEDGYDIIANKLFNIFETKFPHLISNINVESYEMQFLGNPKHWNINKI